MYIPERYQYDDQGEIERFLAENGFGILVSTVDGKPWATHLPMVFEKRTDGSSVLHAHMAKANPQWEAFAANPEVLAIFNGPHAYVSSSWYDHENVPTWNYVAVHVYGKVRLLDEAATRQSLSKLVDQYEAGNEDPVKVDALSERTMRQIRGIVGFEIDIERIEAKRKMSQNRDVKNYQAIVDRLEGSSRPEDRAVAEEMKRRTPFDQAL